jgi:hypothetical protein
MLHDVGAVHAHCLLIKRHLDKASRDHSLKEGPEFSLALLRFAAEGACPATAIDLLRMVEILART